MFVSKGAYGGEIVNIGKSECAQSRREFIRNDLQSTLASFHNSNSCNEQEVSTVP